MMPIWRQTTIRLDFLSKVHLLSPTFRNWSKITTEFRKLNLFCGGMFATNGSASRGAFVVLEGCDRCGKTTQANLLVKNLKQKGHKVEYMRFPDRTTKVGSLISDYLKNEEQLEDHVIHLLFAANRWEMREKMLSLIQSNTTLIVDRFSFSGVAFSLTKPNMDLEWCKHPEVGLPAPDAVILLELDADVASKRGQFGAERYENQKTQRRVREAYEQLKQENWKMVNADKPVDQLQTEILELVEHVIKSSSELPLKALWD